MWTAHDTVSYRLSTQAFGNLTRIIVSEATFRAALELPSVGLYRCKYTGCALISWLRVKSGVGLELVDRVTPSSLHVPDRVTPLSLHVPDRVTPSSLHVPDTHYRYMYPIRIIVTCTRSVEFSSSRIKLYWNQLHMGLVLNLKTIQICFGCPTISIDLHRPCGHSHRMVIN